MEAIQHDPDRSVLGGQLPIDGDAYLHPAGLHSPTQPRNKPARQEPRLYNGVWAVIDCDFRDGFQCARGGSRVECLCR